MQFKFLHFSRLQLDPKSELTGRTAKAIVHLLSFATIASFLISECSSLNAYQFQSF